MEWLTSPARSRNIGYAFDPKSFSLLLLVLFLECPLLLADLLLLEFPVSVPIPDEPGFLKFFLVELCVSVFLGPSFPSPLVAASPPAPCWPLLLLPRFSPSFWFWPSYPCHCYCHLHPCYSDLSCPQRSHHCFNFYYHCSSDPSLSHCCWHYAYGMCQLRVKSKWSCDKFMLVELT